MFCGFSLNRGEYLVHAPASESFEIQCDIDKTGLFEPFNEGGKNVFFQKTMKGITCDLDPGNLPVITDPIGIETHGTKQLFTPSHLPDPLFRDFGPVGEPG